jgi:hypothetical protein
MATTERRERERDVRRGQLSFRLDPVSAPRSSVHQQSLGNDRAPEGLGTTIQTEIAPSPSMKLAPVSASSIEL